MSKALDVANYTPIQTMTPENLRCALLQGYTKMIVGVSYGNIGSMQLKASADAGMEIEAYCWLKHPFVLNEREMIRAFNLIEGLPVKRMWIDVEDVPTGDVGTVQQRVQDVWKAIEWWQRNRPDLPLGIYTAKWWWDRYMPGVKETFGLPLWVAYYPVGQVPENGNVKNFLPGGWKYEDTILWQYAGTIQTCGMNTDRNLVLKEEETRVKYTDAVLDAVFLEYFKALGRHGAEINALGKGLAAVAQTVAELQTFSGDVPTTIADKLNRMLEKTDELEARLQKFAEDGLKAYEALNGSNT